jgi:4-amino-4-deoxy-L-arabinose transferase-like glycosyltransferase
MAGSADFIQRAVHALEAGEHAHWIRRGLAIVAIIGLALFYWLHEFRGIVTPQSMDQAQVGRELARGHGFGTKLIRPLAFGQLQAHHKSPQNISRDTYNAPLPPLIDALALLPVRSHLKMSARDPIYTGDKAIAFIAIAMLLASIVVLFFVARRLFDQRLALLACALVLLCDPLWQYALSGLPQMLMLLLLNATFYALVRAFDAPVAEARKLDWFNQSSLAALLWSVAVGAGFGLLALTHALTLWMFVPALIFCGCRSPLRWRGAVVILATFVCIYLPWLIRTTIVSGNVGGVAIYSALDGIVHSEAGHMRRVALDVANIGPGYFRNKIAGDLVAQFGHIFGYLGYSIVALMFFASLLHRFRRGETTAAQWMLLAMWGGAALGMAAYGVNEEDGVAANQLHILFVPLMTCYGLAFLLVLFNRREIALPFARTGFLALLFLLCAAPMWVSFLFGARKMLVRWPPYVPPYIALLNDWMQPDEIIATDMPWAVAWYADRRALWLPENVKAMTEFSDYRTFGGPVTGLYLTPVSGAQNKLNDIVHGEYKDWAGVILRTADAQKFPLKAATVLPIDNECIFFSDRERWQAAPK